MSARVYVLLDITDGAFNKAAKILHRSPGVAAVELLEGPPDLLFVVEATNRIRLAELTVSALASVENLTENIQLLPRRDGIGAHAHKTCKKG